MQWAQIGYLKAQIGSLGRELDSLTPLLEPKVPQAAMKTKDPTYCNKAWCSQINKILKKKECRWVDYLKLSGPGSLHVVGCLLSQNSRVYTCSQVST